MISPWLNFSFISCVFVYLIIVATIYFVVAYRYPALAAINISARKNHINGESAKAQLQEILLRITAVMENEKLFLDETLSLDKLAQRVELKPYLITRMLNDLLGTNFSSFVNKYRITYAKQMLASEPDASILSIAFRAGFNSKATFNRLFLKYNGMTPTEFRKKANLLFPPVTRMQ